MYKELYNGKYYNLIEKSTDSWKDVDLSGFVFQEVDNDRLIEGQCYLNEYGTTIKHMGNRSYEVIERTPLYALDKITNLSNENQIRLFWILKTNCKNGTYHGI